MSPSLLKVSSSDENKNAPLIQKNTHKDAWELSLVKTVIEKPHFINQILDVLDPSLLLFHSHEFNLALQSHTDAPELMAILVDDSIHVLVDEEALKAELLIFLTKHYERELKKMNLRMQMPFEEKAFHIRKFRGKIAKLKRGELVTYGE